MAELLLDRVQSDDRRLMEGTWVPFQFSLSTSLYGFVFVVAVAEYFVKAYCLVNRNVSRTCDLIEDWAAHLCAATIRYSVFAVDAAASTDDAMYLMSTIGGVYELP